MPNRQRLAAFAAILVASFACLLWLLFPSDSAETKPPQQAAAPVVQTATPLLLSEQADFPSPVIQLQQTLAHGMQHADSPSLPLLRGDLEQFSQGNVTGEQSEPEKLQQLKQRVSALKEITNP